MSINTFDDHVRSHRLITFGKQEKTPTYCESIQDSVNANGWRILREINEYGKITLRACNGPIEIKLETKEKSALPIKAIKDGIGQPWEGPRLIEVPDGQNKMSSSLEKDQYIERHYRDSSILTPSEYLDSLVTEFKDITTIPELNKIVTKVAKQ
ncbi:MAG TPA: hypothetical protein VJ772_06470 [Nitrososphaeraceae archaeon]|nr:hypothetical protein [Nitrososphaeraceae archaeon]